MIESILASLASNILTTKYFWYAAGFVAAYTALFWLLWVLFSVANKRRKRLLYQPFLLTVGLAGLLVDVFYQLTIAILLFMELPKEWTLSSRLSRYLRTYGINSGHEFATNPFKRTLEKWRIGAAVWLAYNLIEPWEPGHLGLVKYGYSPPRDGIKYIIAWLTRKGI